MQKRKLKKSLAFVLVASQQYTRCLKQDIPDIWNNTLFPAITDTYIPLLRMMKNLEKDKIPFHFSLVISPPLCALLDDPLVQEEYALYLDKLIDIGEREIERVKDERTLASLAKNYVKQLKDKKHFFADLCQGMLLPQFAQFASSGHIELLATAASFCFLPHYASIPEAIDAQIEAGLISHRNYFGARAEGFWLPSMGYTNGLEKNIRKYGFAYTVLDSHGFLFADPLPQKGIFAPAQCANSLNVFGRDPKTPFDIAETFASNPVYRNQNRDIGFEASAAALNGFWAGRKKRCATGLKYWSQKDRDSVYSLHAADKQALCDARSFLDEKVQRLEKAAVQLGTDVSLVCTVHARSLGQNWYEGIKWLEQVFRAAAECTDITCKQCAHLLKDSEEVQKIRPFMSAAEGSGFAENLLDRSNSNMFRYALKAAERMIDLAGRFPKDTGLKERSLNLAARQIFVAQSSDWPRMVHENMHADYAARIFKHAVLGFSTVYDSLGANCISTEWLTTTEKDYPFFPWINYRIFGKKR